MDSYMCPLFQEICRKGECGLWVEMTVNKPGVDKQKEGRCSIAWIPILLVELRQTMERKKTEKASTGE